MGGWGRKASVWALSFLERLEWLTTEAVNCRALCRRDWAERSPRLTSLQDGSNPDDLQKAWKRSGVPEWPKVRFHFYDLRMHTLGWVSPSTLNSSTLHCIKSDAGFLVQKGWTSTVVNPMRTVYGTTLITWIWRLNSNETNNKRSIWLAAWYSRYHSTNLLWCTRSGMTAALLTISHKLSRSRHWMFSIHWHKVFSSNHDKDGYIVFLFIAPGWQTQCSIIQQHSTQIRPQSRKHSFREQVRYCYETSPRPRCPDLEMSFRATYPSLVIQLRQN